MLHDYIQETMTMTMTSAYAAPVTTLTALRPAPVHVQARADWCATSKTRAAAGLAPPTYFLYRSGTALAARDLPRMLEVARKFSKTTSQLVPSTWRPGVYREFATSSSSFRTVLQQLEGALQEVYSQGDVHGVDSSIPREHRPGLQAPQAGGPSSSDNIVL